MEQQYKDMLNEIYDICKFNDNWFGDKPETRDQKAQTIAANLLFAKLSDMPLDMTITSGHCGRVAAITKSYLEKSNMYSLTKEQEYDIYLGAKIHDAGKLRTPPEILNYPDELTDEMREIMNKHDIDGIDVLKENPIFSTLLESETIKDVIQYHHAPFHYSEKRPFLIDGEDIPLSARIVAVIDQYDALRANDRPYKDSKDFDKTIEILSLSPALDPNIVKDFLKYVNEIDKDMQYTKSNLTISIEQDNYQPPNDHDIMVSFTASQVKLDHEKLKIFDVNEKDKNKILYNTVVSNIIQNMDPIIGKDDHKYTWGPKYDEKSNYIVGIKAYRLDKNEKKMSASTHSFTEKETNEIKEFMIGKIKSLEKDVSKELDKSSQIDKDR